MKETWDPGLFGIIKDSNTEGGDYGIEIGVLVVVVLLYAVLYLIGRA
jgi:hypothetical protein